MYTEVSDGKGGKIRVKKEKPGKKGKGGKGKKEVAEFSDATTDSDAVDLEAMTEEERERYLAERAIRRAEREKKRREKYGDKYDEMMEAHKTYVLFVSSLPGRGDISAFAFVRDLGTCTNLTYFRDVCAYLLLFNSN